MRYDSFPILAGALLTALTGCGGSNISYRHVDTPAHTVEQYGAPQATQYVLELEPAKETLGITVYEHSVCDKLDVDVVNRTRETLEGDRVISETALGPVQVGSRVAGQVPCEQRFAREAVVSLKVGEAVYPVGKTNSEGRVGINLAKQLDADVYGAPQGDLVVLVRGQGTTETQEVGRVGLSELRAREQQIESLTQELSAVLAKDPGAISPAELSQAYQAYAKLRHVAWYDARFQGLQMRFWEIWQSRQALDAAANLKRNLEALNTAKELLRTSSAASLPLFAQVGINSGTISDRMLEWARFQTLEGMRQSPGACQKGFSWANMPDFFSVEQQIAGGYLRYVYGDPYAQVLGGMCGHLPPAR